MHTTVPVDLLNPGQVFACIGLLEAADLLLGHARGGFDWSEEAQPRFNIQAEGERDPVRAVLEFLSEAEVVAISPDDKLNTNKWSVPTELITGECYPIKQPGSPATLVAALRAQGQQIILDHWGDATQRDNVKFWAGAGGYPGVGLLRDALELIRPLPSDAIARPFSVSATQSSSFRFDWRRDYVPIEIGFSLNAHTYIQPRGFPLVELLAAIGMTHARPQRPGRDKLCYRYAVLAGHDLPLNLLRPALGCAALPFPTRTFSIHMDWPGKAGQARCITDVVEEISA